MKKGFLGFIVLAVLLIILPMKANAESYGFKFEKENNTSDGFDVVIKAVQSGANVFTPAEYKSTMNVKPGAQYDSVISNGNWVITVEGNEIRMVLGAEFTDSEMVVGTLHFNKIDSSNCDVTFTCEGKTTTITNKTPKNPKTGNVLPYAVIVAGIAIATSVYYVTRRNTKFYKI